MKLSGYRWAVPSAIAVWAVPSARISAPPIEPHALVVALCLRLAVSISRGRCAAVASSILFLQKFHVEKKSTKIHKKFDVSFSSIFFCFITFSGVSQQWEFKNTITPSWQSVIRGPRSAQLQKTFYKEVVSKSCLPKKIVNKSKTDFLGFFESSFWAFLGKGSSKTP
jgi:hypothetical protein